MMLENATPEMMTDEGRKEKEKQLRDWIQQTRSVFQLILSDNELKERVTDFLSDKDDIVNLEEMIGGLDDTLLSFSLMVDLYSTNS